MSRYFTNPRRQESSVGIATFAVEWKSMVFFTDKAKALSLVSSMAIGAIKRRTGKGIDIDGDPFRPYSSAYRRALTEGGEDPSKVDLRLTGGMLNSVKELRRQITDRRATAWIGPDTGTSPRVSLRDGHAKRTGKRGPAHNLVGAWLHYGTHKMPARPWLGLSPKDRKAIAAQLTLKQSGVLVVKRH